jgi:hypothetical protein
MWSLALVMVLSQEPTPKMKISVAKLSATTSKAAVGKVLKDQLEPLKGCYDLALKETPGLTGDLAVKFEVGTGTGVAEEPTAVPGGLDQPTLVPCVLARLASTAWPKVKGKNHVELTLHFAVAK